MRQGWSAERQRTNDPRYIGTHLSGPTQQTYRRAWKMMAWHTNALSETRYAAQTPVLDALTDAQKNANTTRYVYFRDADFYLAIGHWKFSGRKASFY